MQGLDFPGIWIDMAAKKKVNGRQKGSTAERKLAKLFQGWWGSSFARTPMSGGFATAKFRDDWNAAGDLVTPDRTFPFCVESKKVEKWTLEQLLTSDKTHIHKWWAQTLDETPSGKIPLLVFTKNHAPLYAMMFTEQMHSELKNAIACRFDTVVNTCEVSIFALDALFKTLPDNWRYGR